MKILGTRKGTIDHTVCSFLMLGSPIEFLAYISLQIVEAVQVENWPQHVLQKISSVLDQTISEDRSEMRSAYRRQAGNPFGHSFINDHVPGIESTHAMCDDVDSFSACGREYLVDSGSQLFCPEIYWTRKVLIRMKHAETM